MPQKKRAAKRNGRSFFIIIVINYYN